MAILKIYNPIVSDEERLDLLWFCGIDGVSFSSVDEFLASVPPEDNTIDLRIHCPGGDVTEGWAITDKLRATGKEIVATIEGQCASMATIVLCAASVRRAAPHASLLIHDPYIPEYTLAGAYHAEDLERIAADLKVEREKMLSFYVERTGADRDVLDAQMTAGNYIDMDRAKELGFIHEITAPKSAEAGSERRMSAEEWNAHKPQNSNTMAKDNKKSAIALAFAALGKALGLTAEVKEEPTVVAYDLNTADGGTITIEKEEGEDPAVGDAASPDGEHKMPDGKTIVIENGVITEIRPADDEDDNDDNDDDESAKALADANNRIAELEAELATAKAAAKTPEEMRILNLVAVAGGEKWLKSAKSNYRPAAKVDGPGKSGKETPVKKSLVQKRLEALEGKKDEE